MIELGQGQYKDKQGLLALTDERLFFLEESLGSETLEAFEIGAISSMSIHKKMTGEALRVHTAGNVAEIASMAHGQGCDLPRLPEPQANRSWPDSDAQVGGR